MKCYYFDQLSGFKGIGVNMRPFPRIVLGGGERGKKENWIPLGIVDAGGIIEEVMDVCPNRGGVKRYNGVYHVCEKCGQPYGFSLDETKWIGPYEGSQEHPSAGEVAGKSIIWDVGVLRLHNGKYMIVAPKPALESREVLVLWSMFVDNSHCLKITPSPEVTTIGYDCHALIDPSRNIYKSKVEILAVLAPGQKLIAFLGLTPWASLVYDGANIESVSCERETGSGLRLIPVNRGGV